MICLFSNVRDIADRIECLVRESGGQKQESLQEWLNDVGRQCSLQDFTEATRHLGLGFQVSARGLPDSGSDLHGVLVRISHQAHHRSTTDVSHSAG